MPPYVTLTRSGSKAAPELPSSLTMRPQYGSWPYHEHFTSWLSATRRAARRASSVDAAPVTTTSTTLVAPSASPAIWRARSAQASATASASRSSSVRPRDPLARRSTVSLVDVHPSTERALNERSTPAWRTARRTSGTATASVVSTASIVAMLGESMAAPLAIPPTRKGPASRTTSLRTVSVVRMASAAAVPPSARSPAAAAGTPSSMAAIGRGMPIRPVEQTRTSVGRQPTSDAHQGAGALRVPLAGGAGGGVGVAAVDHDRGRPPLRRRQVGLGHQHRGGRGPVGREDAGGGNGPAVGRGQQGEVGRAGGLDAAWHAGGDEPLGGGHAHG